MSEQRFELTGELRQPQAGEWFWDGDIQNFRSLKVHLQMIVPIARQMDRPDRALVEMLVEDGVPHSYAVEAATAASDHSPPAPVGKAEELLRAACQDLLDSKTEFTIGDFDGIRRALSQAAPACKRCGNTGRISNGNNDDRDPCPECTPASAKAPEGCGLTFAQLRDVSADRAKLWHNGTTPPLSFRLMELAGETGEACNAGKKLARAEMGMVGGTTDKSNLRDELADVVICADLVATQAGIDLGAAVVEKFNKTSEKHGFPHRLQAAERGRA